MSGGSCWPVTTHSVKSNRLPMTPSHSTEVVEIDGLVVVRFHDLDSIAYADTHPLADTHAYPHPYPHSYPHTHAHATPGARTDKDTGPGGDSLDYPAAPDSRL